MLMAFLVMPCGGILARIYRCSKHWNVESLGVKLCFGKGIVPFALLSFTFTLSKSEKNRKLLYIASLALVYAVQN